MNRKTPQIWNRFQRIQPAIGTSTFNSGAKWLADKVAMIKCTKLVIKYLASLKNKMIHRIVPFVANNQVALSHEPGKASVSLWSLRCRRHTKRRRGGGRRILTRQRMSHTQPNIVATLVPSNASTRVADRAQGGLILYEVHRHSLFFICVHFGAYSHYWPPICEQYGDARVTCEDKDQQ
jgi:hypothetical protein